MFAAQVPSPLKGLLRGFTPLLNKPQQDNLARIVVGLVTNEGEKNVKGISDTFIPHKDQSNLNRFITDAKWDYRELNRRRIKLVEDELELAFSDRCALIIDDTVVERYGGEGVGYHHDSKHGLVKGHCYVTEICFCSGVSYPVDLRLYMPEGTSSKPFRSKIDLACELIDEFDPPSKKDVAVQFDEWYLCGEVVKHAEDRGFRWISEARSNRVVFYDEEKLNVSELMDRMRPFFRDVEVDGELYQCLDVETYMSRLRNVRLLFNCRADGKDMHNLCSNIKDLSAERLLKRSFERAKIEAFHWDIKNVLGFGEYRFRESDAAITHSHLVLLTYSLLLILKKRVEKRNEERTTASISIGEACRIVRDRCLVAICRWFREMYSACRSITDVLHMIRPHIQIYK